MTDHNPICEPIDMQQTILQQQATIERLTEQLNAATEQNAKLISGKYPFAHIMIDCSEYEKDLAIRNKLIELGWTPPAEIEAGKVSMLKLTDSIIINIDHFECAQRVQNQTVIHFKHREEPWILPDSDGVIWSELCKLTSK